ncbi:pentatricopeptide repeat domain-containing protein 3, mitochondrial-like isoform X2 [Dendronephthya gigantea]|uniref:pentatricopeptide repeat domain-containing protein 3, mitochondrial-like isoform X1 n=1 Tax=Dendronephthya gigantea TaxID=151771 RepID=UPI00106B376C|nr:pentatricopeptide repeat domain-containing protein 3, mitochondrial-like isoform X1 [Dendronephthya gigantea]XP_028403344.1 pentatricopeptide repeat domain-containing protein 3, mitochondrial-like isoform X2 [Dendronephthya gigantea]
MAVVLCRKCFRRVPGLFKIAGKPGYNCLISQSAQEEADHFDPSTEYSPELKEEKLKVLKALASTIKYVPNAPIHGFFEDPFLMPRSSIRKNEFAKAREEGKKAAEYIIKTYPHLFPLRKPEPAWPKELSLDVKGNDERTLQDLIALKQIEKAIRLYEQLVAKGESVSLDCENSLLELTGYYGFQRSDADSKSSKDSPYNETIERQKWSSKNFAHQLFKRMSNKNGRSYEAMILSLLKFQSKKLALEIFDEMKEKGFKGSVFLYNRLIESSEQLCSDETDPWTFSQDIVKHLNSEPAVRPNLGTFTSLLKICAVHSPSAYEDSTKILREMYSLGIEPSLGCYTHLLEAAERNGKGHAAVNNIVRHLKSLDHQFTPENTADYDFFVTAMATARHFRDGVTAMELFQLSETSHFKQFLGPRSLSFYGNLLCSLALSEHASKVMNAYQQLVPKYFVPREWIYVELLRCLEKSKQPQTAIELYNDMKQYRVNMTVHTCRSFVSCFSVKLAKKDLPEYITIMEEIFNWMEFFDIEMDNFMMSQMIRLYCLNGQLDMAWMNMEKFSGKNFIPMFAALSSLLQGTLVTKEKEKTKKVFEMMAAQGYRLNASLRNSYYRDLNFTAEECYKIDQLFANLPSRVSTD